MSNITQKNELTFDFQVNLNIFAIGGDIFLKKVYILNKKGNSKIEVVSSQQILEVLLRMTWLNIIL
jgi:hypothetical protein